MKKIENFLFLNQMAGPLFRELAEDVSATLPKKSTLYTGHKDTLKAPKNKALQIYEAPTYNRKSKYTRLISWIHYTFYAFFWILKAKKNTAVMIVSNPPILGPIATLACKIRRLPYIVLVYDMHPDTLISFGEIKADSLLCKLWRLINRYVWQNSTAVYTIGAVMGKKLSAQFDASKTLLKKVEIIPPWADTNFIKPIPKNINPLSQELNQEHCLTILYSGNMGISHDIDSMLDAALLLKDDADIKFLFIGEGAKWQTAKDFARMHSLDNVQVLPFQPEEKLPYTMALADISLVALDKGAEGLMVPSKLYYYMAAGSAVIGICQGENDLEASINLANCGVITEPGCPQNIAEAIRKIKSDPIYLTQLKINARHACEQHYSRNSCIHKLITSLKSINLIPS